MARKKEKQSFLLYKDWRGHFNKTNAWEMIQAIFDYQESGKLPDRDNDSISSFYAMLPQMERDIEAYKEKCEKNKENIEKYWAKEKERREERES